MSARLKTLGAEVSSLGRDRAKALITLAQTGRDCLSIPEVFPLSHELAQGSSLAIFRRLRHAQQALTQARERLATAQTSPPGSVQTQRAQAMVENHEVEVKRWQDVRRASRTHLPPLSLILHPWNLLDALRQTSTEGERRLRAAGRALETLLATHGFPAKDDTLTTVRTQLAGGSARSDLWGQRVERDGEDMALRSSWTHWGDEVLLPRMSWHEHLSRTRCPGQKAPLALALQAIQEECERQPCTGQLGPEGLADWKGWAADHAKAFPRASSAVEGRNGSLSQMQHTHRGVPKRHSPVWTVLHNFECRASDGTPPASRFFRREFPDLFENV